jgi:hypothetical protein
MLSKKTFTINVMSNTYSIVDILTFSVIIVFCIILILLKAQIDEIVAIAIAAIIILLRIESKYVFALVLFGLISMPILQLIKEDSLSETIATYVFYALVIGFIATLLEGQQSRVSLKINKFHNIHVGPARLPDSHISTQGSIINPVSTRLQDSQVSGGTIMPKNNYRINVHSNSSIDFRQISTIKSKPESVRNHVISTYEARPKLLPPVRDYSRQTYSQQSVASGGKKISIRSVDGIKHYIKIDSI